MKFRNVVALMSMHIPERNHLPPMAILLSILTGKALGVSVITPYLDTNIPYRL